MSLFERTILEYTPSETARFMTNYMNNKHPMFTKFREILLLNPKIIKGKFLLLIKI